MFNFDIFQIVGDLHKKGKCNKYWKYIWYYVSPYCYVTHIYGWYNTNREDNIILWYCKPNIILPYWINIGIVQRVSDFKVLIKILKITNPKSSRYWHINIPYHIKSLSIFTLTDIIPTIWYDATYSLVNTGLLIRHHQ